MSLRVRVVGVGMIPFTTPIQAEPYEVTGSVLFWAALADAGVDYAKVQ